MSDQTSLWLKVHRPVLEEFHRVESSLRDHALEVARISRTRAGQATLDAALDRLDRDRATLGRVCRILTSCVAPPDARAAARLKDAVIKLSGAVVATSLGSLVTDFEDGCADLEQAEAALVVPAAG